jgi:hypothetical protein
MQRWLSTILTLTITFDTTLEPIKNIDRLVCLWVSTTLEQLWCMMRHTSDYSMHLCQHITTRNVKQFLLTRILQCERLCLRSWLLHRMVYVLGIYHRTYWSTCVLITKKESENGEKTSVLLDFSSCMYQWRKGRIWKSLWCYVRKVSKLTWLDSIYLLKHKWSECATC